MNEYKGYKGYAGEAGICTSRSGGVVCKIPRKYARMPAMAKGGDEISAKENVNSMRETL